MNRKVSGAPDAAPARRDMDVRRRHGDVGRRTERKRRAARRSERLRLEARLRDRIGNDPDAVSFPVCPLGVHGVAPRSAGHSGSVRSYLLTRADGTRTYILPMPRAALARDPTLGGRRADAERECLSRGAGFEIWTEFEIDMNLAKAQVVRPATAAERSAWLSTEARADPCGPGIMLTLACRLDLGDMRSIGGGWVGRCRLTGIVMALMCDLVIDPETRLLVWRPVVPKGTIRRRDPVARTRSRRAT